MLRSAPGGERWFVHTQLKLYGSAVLAGSNQQAEAITFETERYRVVSTPDLDTVVRQEINLLVDGFARAYKSANP